MVHPTALWLVILCAQTPQAQQPPSAQMLPERQARPAVQGHSGAPDEPSSRPATEPSSGAPTSPSSGTPSAGASPPLSELWRARQAACAAGPNAACDAATQGVVTQAARAHWPSARAYSAVLVQEAVSAEPKRALALAQAAVALGPTEGAALWSRVRALWRTSAWGAASSAALAATVQAAAQGPHWALPAYTALRAALGLLAAVALTAFALSVPQLAHDCAHLLPSSLRHHDRVLAVILSVLALGFCLVMPLGPGLTALALAATTLPHMQALWRGHLRHIALVTAVLLLTVVHVLQHTAAAQSAPGLRLRALEDATAPWAQASLPPATCAVGDDLWAQALLARRRGDQALAEQLAERAIAAGETHEALLVLEANLLWERADHLRARAFYEQALAQAPDMALARYNLSVTLLSLADPTGAEAARAQAFQVGGPSLTAQVARAQASGQVLLDPTLPPRLTRSLGDGAELPLWRLAWQATRPSLLGSVALGPALLLLFAWALLHGCLKLLAQWPTLEERMAQLVPVTGRCSRCAALSCPRCNREAWEAGLCSLCQRAALGADSDASALRDQQEAKSLAHYRTRAALRRAVSFLVPGAALAQQRWVLLGIAMYVCSATSAICALYAWRLLPPPFALWALPFGPGTRALAIACTLGAVGPWVISSFAARRDP